jgi:hypothetical protein
MKDLMNDPTATWEDFEEGTQRVLKEISQDTCGVLIQKLEKLAELFEWGITLPQGDDTSYSLRMAHHHLSRMFEAIRKRFSELNEIDEHETVELNAIGEWAVTNYDSLIDRLTRFRLALESFEKQKSKIGESDVSVN